MTPQQIGQLYDSFTPEEQDLPREQFIKRMSDALDPTKMMAEAEAIAGGRIQKAQIDAAIRRGQG